MSYSSVNRVILIGRLTSDPELRALPSGTTVCGLRIACSDVRKTEDGEYVEKPNFFSVSVFGPHGETVHRYMRRGRLVGVDGRLRWSEWETAEGAKRQAVDIVAEKVQFLEGGGSGEHAGDSEGGSPSEELDLDGGGERELVGVGAGASLDDDVEF